MPGCGSGVDRLGDGLGGAVGAHADLYDLAGVRVIWRRSGCDEGEGPGAKLDAA